MPRYAPFRQLQPFRAYRGAVVWSGVSGAGLRRAAVAAAVSVATADVALLLLRGTGIA